MTASKMPVQDILMTGNQMALLCRAATRGGSTLNPEYRGAFCSLSGQQTCIAFHGDYEDLHVFYAVVDTHDAALAACLKTRHVYDRDQDTHLGPGTHYWPGVLAANPEQLPEAHDLAHHLAAVHKNAAAPGNSFAENLNGHYHEHYGPGGLRHHNYADLSFDETALLEVLGEAETQDHAVSRLRLRYIPETGCVQAGSQSPAADGAARVQEGKVVLCIDPAREQIVSFGIADFRYFVSYHLLGELFGDEALRDIAAFQTAVAAAPERSQTLMLPHPNRRAIKALLKNV